MAKLHPYLNFPGNTEEAFNFYKSVFGGEFIVLQRFGDTPEAEKIPEADRDKIMHVAFPIGENILMGTDALESTGHHVKIGDNISLSLDAASEAEADKLFKGLSAGGKVDMELQKTFWNAYFGMVTDKFGIKWMINHDYDKQ